MRRRRHIAVMIGVIVLSTGLTLTSGHRGAQAAPAADNPGKPFQAILDKLDQVLAAITGAAGQDNHTLRWDTNNPSASRFTTAFLGAVLDKNTGLAWEQAPDATPAGHTWVGATSHCLTRNVGGTVGWRLPSVVELKSAQDPTLSAPFVPASAFTIGGNPGVQSAIYWSATTDAENPAFAWNVHFGLGLVGASNKAVSGHAWCVRGPMQESVY